MSLTELNEKIIRLGKRLLGRLKYELPWRYSRYAFLVYRHAKHEALEQKIVHSLYKKKV